MSDVNSSKRPKKYCIQWECPECGRRFTTREEEPTEENPPTIPPCPKCEETWTSFVEFEEIDQPGACREEK